MSAELHLTGIQVGNLSSVDERFICSHCELVLRDAVQGDCGHRFCKNCVHIKWKESQLSGAQSLCKLCDPDDEPATISPDRTYPDNAIRREMRKLKVQCPHESCEEKMLLKDLESHVTECPMRPQKCPACGQEVPHSLLSEHEVKDCPKRLVECDACGEKVAFNELSEHSSKFCIGSTKQCEFCGVRVKDDEASRDEHQLNECLVGWHQTKPCPYGCGKLENWEKHRTECVAKHLDRMLSRIKELRRMPAVQQQPKSNVTPVISDAGEPSISVPGELPDADAIVSKLNSVRERCAAIRMTLEPVRLPDAVTDDRGQEYQRFMERMKAAFEKKGEIEMSLTRIKTNFEACDARIRQHETKLRTSLNKKLEVEKKHQELVKLLAYKEVQVSELERRLEVLEHASFDGVLVWKIRDVKKRKEEAREGKSCSIYSPPFYTGKAGYKMRGRLYLNGDGTGKNTHISLFFVIMRGEFDALLPWPFAKKVSMMLLDQNSEEHVIDAFKPDVTSSSFKRPTTEMNIASGCPLFMPIKDFEDAGKGYVKEDTMFIKFIVDKSDLPS